jgi:hypothetical protein
MLTKHLSQAVKLWFQNFARKRGRVGRVQYIKKKNWYNAAANQYKQDVKDNMADEHPGLDTKSPGYLAAYQQCLKEITDALSDDEIENLRSIAQAWNESGPPDEVKRR